MTSNFMSERSSKLELLEVIQTMKNERSLERNVFESIAVKQDILQRRRAEYESAQLLANQAEK